MAVWLPVSLKIIVTKLLDTKSWNFLVRLRDYGFYIANQTIIVLGIRLAFSWLPQKSYNKNKIGKDIFCSITSHLAHTLKVNGSSNVGIIQVSCWTQQSFFLPILCLAPLIKYDHEGILIIMVNEEKLRWRMAFSGFLLLNAKYFE